MCSRVHVQWSTCVVDVQWSTCVVDVQWSTCVVDVQWLTSDCDPFVDRIKLFISHYLQ